MPLRADFQAIATVLGRREVSHDPYRFRLDLRGVALGMVDFAEAQLQYAIFADARLQKAHFLGAHLQGAIFTRAQLKEADFSLAEVQGAWFVDALGLTPEQFEGVLNADKALLPDHLDRALESKPDDQPAE